MMNEQSNQNSNFFDTKTTEVIETTETSQVGFSPHTPAAQGGSVGVPAEKTEEVDDLSTKQEVMDTIEEITETTTDETETTDTDSDSKHSQEGTEMSEIKSSNEYCSEYEQYGQSIYDTPKPIIKETWFDESDESNDEFEYEIESFYTRIYGKDSENFSTTFFVGVLSVWVVFFAIPYITGISNV
jgi:hypothetical protein